MLALAAGDCQWYGTLGTTMSDRAFPSRSWWQGFPAWPRADWREDVREPHDGWSRVVYERVHS